MFSYFWLYIILGQYDKNQCSHSDTYCIKCPLRLPSCIGLQDGNNTFPTRLWKPDYIKCYKNRTLDIRKCADGYFHPNVKNCLKDVQRGTYEKKTVRLVIILQKFRINDKTITKQNPIAFSVKFSSFEFLTFFILICGRNIIQNWKWKTPAMTWWRLEYIIQHVFYNLETLTLTDIPNCKLFIRPFVVFLCLTNRTFLS